MGRLEQKEIRYSGYSTLPDDYQCKDGAIAFATNATYEDGGLKRIPEALPIALLVAQGADVYIHHTVNYYHYIIIYPFTDEDGSAFVRLYVVDREVMERYLSTVNEESGVIPTFVDAMYHCAGSTFDEDTDPEHNKPLNMSAGVVDFLYRCDGAFVSLVAVGNTLIVSTDAAMYYFLCKAGGLTEDDEQTPLTEYCPHPYIFLGNKVPSVEVEFALELECTLKAFTGTGITKTNRSLPSSTDYVDLQFVSCTVHSSDEPVYLSNTIIFQAGHSYRFSISSSIWVAAIDEMNIWGTKDGDDSPSLIRNLELGSKLITINITEDYHDIYITLTAHNDWYPASIEMYVQEAVTVGGDTYGEKYYVDYTADNYTAVFGCINKFIASFATAKNRFIHPFFVRYAVRMYDSSVCELSSPMLMVPNSGYAPFVYCNNLSDSNASHDTLELYAFVGALQYRLVRDIGVEWHDVIQGIDIYISQPIYPYDEGEEYDADEMKFTYKDYITDSDNERDELTNLSWGYGHILSAQGVDLTDYYSPMDLFGMLQDLYSFCDNTYNRLTLAAPKSEEELDEEMKSVSSFYLLKTYSLEDLSASDDFTTIECKKGYLEGLMSHEVLSEDVLGYDTFIGCGVYSYNQRLHMYGGLLRYRDAVLLPRQCQHLDDTYDPNYTRCAYWWFYEAWVYIRTDEGTKVVHTRYDEGAFFTGSVWFFYPNNRAVKVVIGYAFDEGDREQYLSLPLHEHEFLNGAYFLLRTLYGLLDDAFEEYKIDERPADGADTVASTSIYVSEVDNPFVFRNSTTVTAGSGQVLALSTAAQAMSQGQFGQYPLYAFTDEGIWSLSINSDGTYGTSQPLSRDVVTNVNSITQLDSSVLFVTDRGIMEVYGSTVACISDSIDGEWGEFNPLDLPYFLDLYMQYIECVLPSDEGYADKVAAVEAMFAAWAKRRFFEFIQTCRMVYDYTHQRIIVYNDDSRIAYVLSLKSKEWGLLFTDLRRTINSYPDALALRKVGDGEYEGVSEADGEEHWCLENLSTYRSVAEGVSVDDDVSTELFVSRPFKLDAPDIYKTVDSIVQRGYFQQSMQENHIVGVVLYGSPDLFNWFIVAQSSTDEVAGGLLSAGHIIDKVQGDPYKYFRVVVVTRLSAKESVCGCSVLYELKDNNILR